MANYKRVLPRDAFNEAKLLKCIGKLTLMIEDGMLSAWAYHYDGEPFNIEQDTNDGSISVTNITFWEHKRQVKCFTPLNSKSPWPLVALVDEGEGHEQYMFNDHGDLVYF